VACLVVPAWVALTRWESLSGAHPAYPVTLAVVAAAGAVWLAVAGNPMSREGPRSGGTRSEDWKATLLDRRLRRPGWVRRVWRVGRVAGAVALVAVLLTLAWLRPFPAEEVALRDERTGERITVVDSAATIELRPADHLSGAGLVFYPATRVDPQAYLGLLRPLARQGHLVVVVKPPYGFAPLDGTAARRVMDAHPEVSRWTVGGHAGGGTTAARYAASGDRRVSALLLWASCPDDDLSARTDLAVWSVSGSLDTLTTPAEVARTRPMLPASTRYVVVPGAVHSFFGDYGPQPGDGEPDVGRADAQGRIVAASGEAVAARTTG
jgi:pimeloyl-ACP methyl ester carboxylesterase